MAYLYFSPDGLRVDEAEWKAGQADEGVRVRRRFDNEDMYAALVWNGRLTKREHSAFRDTWPLFQLIVKNYREDGSLVPDPVFDGVTYPNEDAAIKGYEEMLMQITDAVRKEDGSLDEVGNIFIPPPPPDPNVPADVFIEGLTDDVGAW